jgi:hypothetical protein
MTPSVELRGVTLVIAQSVHPDARVRRAATALR